MSKAAIITGAAKGIGAAVSRRLASDGARLICLDLDGEALEPLVRELRETGADVKGLIGSVADPACCEEAVGEAVKAFGGLDWLSHNAGIQRYGSAASTSPETWAEVMDVNLNSAYHLTRAALPEIVKRQGAIVLMASVQSLATQRNVAAYTVAKHGLLGLAKSIAVDFAGQGVRCNAVAPGSVDTPMLRDALALADDEEAVWKAVRDMHPMGRTAKPEEVANVVAFLLSDQSSFVTGEIIRVDGGLLAAIGGSPKENDE